MNRETYEKVYFQENYARQFSALCGDQDTSRTAAAPAVDQAPMPNATTVAIRLSVPINVLVVMKQKRLFLVAQELNAFMKKSLSISLMHAVKW